VSSIDRRSIFATDSLTYAVSVSNYRGERHINLHHPAVGALFWSSIQHDYNDYDERNVITIRLTQSRHGIEQWPQMCDFATPSFDAAYSPQHYLEMIRLYPIRDVLLDDQAHPSSLHFYGMIELIMHDKRSSDAVQYSAAIRCRLRFNVKTGHTLIDAS